MSITDIGIIFGISMSVAGGGGVAGKYYMDHEYVTIGSVQEAFTKRDITLLKRQIRKLEYLRKKGIITDAQDWELQGLYQELEELQ